MTLELQERFQEISKLKRPELYATLASTKLAAESQSLATIWTRLGVFQVLVSGLFAGGVWLLSKPASGNQPLWLSCTSTMAGVMALFGSSVTSVLLILAAWPRQTSDLFSLDSCVDGIRKHLHERVKTIGTVSEQQLEASQSHYELVTILNCMAQAADTLHESNAYRLGLLQTASKWLVGTAVVFLIAAILRSTTQ